MMNREHISVMTDYYRKGWMDAIYREIMSNEKNIRYYFHYALKRSLPLFTALPLFAEIIVFFSIWTSTDSVWLSLILLLVLFVNLILFIVVLSHSTNSRNEMKEPLTIENISLQPESPVLL